MSKVVFWGPPTPRTILANWLLLKTATNSKKIANITHSASFSNRPPGTNKGKKPPGRSGRFFWRATLPNCRQIATSGMSGPIPKIGCMSSTDCVRVRNTLPPEPTPFIARDISQHPYYISAHVRNVRESGYRHCGAQPRGLWRIRYVYMCCTYHQHIMGNSLWKKCIIIW